MVKFFMKDIDQPGQLVLFSRDMFVVCILGCLTGVIQYPGELIMIGKQVKLHSRRRLGHFDMNTSAQKVGFVNCFFGPSFSAIVWEFHYLYFCGCCRRRRCCCWWR